MRPWYRAATILLLCIWIGISPCLRVLAANDEEVKLLLQKGLTVYEIDQELARIQLEEASITKQKTATEQELQLQLIRSEETKRHAAKVLRAYYMGDRDSLWMLLFTISSFKDAITTLDYLQMIVRNDHEALKMYSESKRQLTELQQTLVSSQTTLQQTKQRYITQREQMIKLQKQLDEDLSKQKDAALIIQQMAQLTLSWKEKGIPLFKTYFQALATALKQLPEIISEDSKGITKHLIINGFQYTFQITDDELNQFLRTKNPLFQNMTFRFTDTELITAGTQDGIDISIKGKYELATKEEGKGKAYIRFNMTQLQFNGFDLPISTVEAMEQEFDLGIYPQNLAPFLSVTGLKLEAGKLSIMLKMSL
ncbi:hypothetical protein SAMN03159341_10572 [Paenibacillus sp. 1_12]|uniref:hypothetical protein n=1 Tax=Paenibacillus sp. 1_12 TaxID=1566278 RepID=UPI0008EB7CB8|nr:hypothetical protein [Paenibacillus sp. 1_12]SFL32112.1 hypothetical protein SAMN03159341_10572 [Paenibacillus sp. 1_12]